MATNTNTTTRTTDRNRIDDVRQLSASSITGTRVDNTQGEHVGDIKDLMIGLRDGRVRYAVLEFGGVMGVGNKLFAVPFDAFGVDSEEERFVLDVDKDVLKNAEGFDKNDWPDFADRTFEQRLHDYYDVAPYWNR